MPPFTTRPTVARRPILSPVLIVKQLARGGATTKHRGLKGATPTQTSIKLKRPRTRRVD